MHIAEMLNQFDTEPRQPILVCDDDGCDLATDDTVDQGNELRARELQPVADLFDPLIDIEPTSRPDAEACDQ